MSHSSEHKAMLEELRKLLAMQIKLDIASTIRQDPRLDTESSKRAYEKLANDSHIDKLVRDLAYEETQAAVERGEVPPAALLLLAGFKPNPITDC